jgi:hypothetical protein
LLFDPGEVYYLAGAKASSAREQVGVALLQKSIRDHKADINTFQIGNFFNKLKTLSVSNTVTLNMLLEFTRLKLAAGAPTHQVQLPILFNHFSFSLITSYLNTYFLWVFTRKEYLRSILIRYRHES